MNLWFDLIGLTLEVIDEGEIKEEMIDGHNVNSCWVEVNLVFWCELNWAYSRSGQWLKGHKSNRRVKSNWNKKKMHLWFDLVGLTLEKKEIDEGEIKEEKINDNDVNSCWGWG